MKKKITKAKLEKKEKRRLKRELKEAWKKVRLEVLERDNYECQMCKHKLDPTKPSGTHTHHIVPRQYKELFLDKNNLLTLCTMCHKWSKRSAHQNAIYFVMWFKDAFPDRFVYLYEKMVEIHKKERLNSIGLHKIEVI